MTEDLNAKPNVIDRFRGANRWLSNFWVVDIQMDGVVYKSTEHAFQAWKTNDDVWKRAIRMADTCGQAKALGKACPMRSDWEQIKDEVMYRVCCWKFAQHPELREKLLATGDAHLEEGNEWHDSYWGVRHCGSCPQGQNKLGKTLMRIRSELR